MKGLFITFEGGEGSGKSTQISALKKRLEEAGREVIETREPGGTQLGESIRHLLQYDEAGKGMSAESELLLFAASRAQHVRELIAPALAAGKIVLCDRFLDSSAIYQGVARVIDARQVKAINEFAVGPTKPDLTILIDLSPEVGLALVRARSNGEFDLMEQESLEFFQAVRTGYLDIAAVEPERFTVLDGNQSVKQLSESIGAIVDAKIS